MLSFPAQKHRNTKTSETHKVTVLFIIFSPPRDKTRFLYLISLRTLETAVLPILAEKTKNASDLNKSEAL